MINERLVSCETVSLSLASHGMAIERLIISAFFFLLDGLSCAVPYLG